MENVVPVLLDGRDRVSVMILATQVEALCKEIE